MKSLLLHLLCLMPLALFAEATQPTSIFDLSVETIQGEMVPLSKYKGKVLLIVNTASKCGLTPQYEGLEKLHKKYGEQGLTVLGFPCNQFGNQEPLNGEEITRFCQKNFGVTFEVFAKISVNGENTHPIYQILKKQAPGLLGSQAIKWNFTKFLVSKDGKTITRFSPRSKPATLAKDIENALAMGSIEK